MLSRGSASIISVEHVSAIFWCFPPDPHVPDDRVGLEPQCSTRREALLLIHSPVFQGLGEKLEGKCLLGKEWVIGFNLGAVSADISSQYVLQSPPLG